MESSSIQVLHAAPDNTVTPPEKELRKFHCFCLVHKNDLECFPRSECTDPGQCSYCKRGHCEVRYMLPEAEVTEVTPPTESSPTPVPYAAPDSTVTPPKKEPRKFHCFCAVHKANDIGGRHSVCRDPLHCLYCERGHRKVILMAPEEYADIEYAGM